MQSSYRYTILYKHSIHEEILTKFFWHQVLVLMKKKKLVGFVFQFPLDFPNLLPKKVSHRAQGRKLFSLLFLKKQSFCYLKILLCLILQILMQIQSPQLFFWTTVKFPILYFFDKNCWLFLVISVISLEWMSDLSFLSVVW